MKTGDSFNLNLLPSQAKFQATRMKLKGIFRKYMAVAAGLWVFLILVTIIYSIIVEVNYNSENKKYTQVFNSFKGMSNEIVMSQLIKYRIKVLGQVMSDRFEYSTAFEKIVSLFTGKAELSKFEIDLNRDFKVVIKATTQEAVDYVEDVVADANTGKVEGIKSMKIKSVNYSKTGEWLVNMDIVLKK